jgi:hypothetical protein
VNKRSPINITDAAESHEKDISTRETRYLIAMGARIVCFILAVFLFHGWLRWVAAILAIILPWIAVLIANNRAEAKRLRSDAFTTSGDAPELPQQPVDSAPHSRDDGRPEDDVVYGEIVNPLPPGTPEDRR